MVEVQQGCFWFDRLRVFAMLYPRCILGHKIGGFRTSEGLPNKHECLGKIMLIMEIKF